MNHAKPFGLRYWSDASPSSDGFAFFFCWESFSGELHWRQSIIQEREEEFEITSTTLKMRLFFLIRNTNSLKSFTGSLKPFPFSNQFFWMSHKGAICAKVICFDGKCLWLTFSSISLLPSSHFFHFLGDLTENAVFSMVLLSWVFAVSDSNLFW